MKKCLLYVLLLSFFVMSADNVYAGNKDVPQDVKYYGSEKGGFSFTIGLVPLVNFIGNMFNGTTDQSFSGFGDVNSSSFNGSVLSASYFLTNKISLTAGVGFNMNSNRKYSYDNNYEKESVKVTGSNEFMFTVGANYLLRPGARLQPILGCGLLYGFTNTNFEKVNDKTSVDADFNHKTPSSTFGIVGNIGVEFFVSKAISLSAVADLALTTTWNKSKVNDWDEQKTTLNSAQTKFTTGKFGGNLGVNFYF